MSKRSQTRLTVKLITGCIASFLLETPTFATTNKVVIAGVVTRMMTNPKNPISAAVTATIAITRAAPRLFRKPARPCNEPAPQDSAARADWAIIAYGMVSIWLMKVKGAGELSSTQKIGLPGKGRFS